MIIRSEQMLALREDASDAFELEMTEHLAAFAPRLYELRGQEVFLGLVRAGRARAEAYGFSFRGPVRMILESMIAFGFEFDSDPQFPFISGALHDRKTSDQMARADKVFERIEEYRNTVLGARGEFAIAALERLQNMAGIGAASESPEDLLAKMRWTFPQRFDHAGEAAMRELVERAAETSTSAALSNFSEAVPLLTALMFGFGHGVLEDPLYPWVGSALSDPLMPSAQDRFARLKSRSILYMQHVLKHWKEVYAG